VYTGDIYELMTLDVPPSIPYSDMRRG